MEVKSLMNLPFFVRKEHTNQSAQPHNLANGLLSSLLQQHSAEDQKLRDRLKGGESSPTCWQCQSGEAETIGHVLLTCPKYEEIRRELLNQLRQNLVSLGDRGNHAWDCFVRGSLSYQVNVILGVLQFGGSVDAAIAQFSTDYAAKAWNGRIVI